MLLREGGCYCPGNPIHRNYAPFQAAGNISHRVYHLLTCNPELLSEGWSFKWKVYAELPGSPSSALLTFTELGTLQRGRCQRQTQPGAARVEVWLTFLHMIEWHPSLPPLTLLEEGQSLMAAAIGGFPRIPMGTRTQLWSCWQEINALK